MKKQLAVMSFVVLSSVAMLAEAARTAPLNEPQNLVLSGPKSAADAKKIILAAALSRGWRVVKESPNNVRFQYSRGRHTAVIEVPFTANSYGIKYVSSDNLNYGERDSGKVIHPTYNKWVDNLVRSINVESARY